MYSWGTMALISIFLLKALYFAFFITPLWDIPDETGHLAYILHIVNGGGLPILGDANISAEIIQHLTKNANAGARHNWIAQHPPLYYYVAAVPYLIAQLFTSNVELLFRIPRVIAAICGAFTLLVLYKTFCLLKVNEKTALCIAGCVGWIPMFSHMASGTSHDVPIFLMGALCTHYFVRFVLNKKVTDAYVAALWLSLGAAMKMTVWVLIPPFMLFIALEIRGGWTSWLKHNIGIGILATSSAIIWMIRNFYQYGNSFYTAVTNNKWKLEEPLNESILIFLGKMPVIDYFLLNFYGLIGGVGTGLGKATSWFQINGIPRGVFTVTLVISAIILTWQFIIYNKKMSIGNVPWLNHKILTSRLTSYSLGVMLVFITTVTVFMTLMIFSIKGGSEMNLRLFSFALIFSIGIGSFITIFLNKENEAKIFLYGLAAFSFFCLTLLINIHGIYLLDGRLRATHGRYLYPAIPWLIVAFALAIKRISWSRGAMVVIFIALVMAEVDAYMNQVLPFLN